MMPAGPPPSHPIHHPRSLLSQTVGTMAEPPRPIHSTALFPLHQLPPPSALQFGNPSATVAPSFSGGHALAISSAPDTSTAAAAATAAAITTTTTTTTAPSAAGPLPQQHHPNFNPARQHYCLSPYVDSHPPLPPLQPSSGPISPSPLHYEHQHHYHHHPPHSYSHHHQAPSPLRTAGPKASAPGRSLPGQATFHQSSPQTSPYELGYEPRFGSGGGRTDDRRRLRSLYLYSLLNPLTYGKRERGGEVIYLMHCVCSSFVLLHKKGRA